MSDMTFGPELEDYYYEGDKGRYLCRDAHGAWMPITTRDLKLRLAQKGFETEKAKGDLDFDGGFDDLADSAGAVCRLCRAVGRV
jgi:hypothetical protein